MRIIVDAMGGDNAPESAVWGGALAAKEYGEEVLLVGKPEVVANVLKEKGLSDVRGITIMPANDLVDMHDDPATVLRHKPDSSMAVAFAAQGRGGDARFPRATPAHCSPAQRCTAAASRASDAVHWHRLCRARTVRSCCAMRVQTPNAPPKCCPVRVPRFAVCGEDKRCRQAACRPCQQRHGGYQG